MIFHLDFILTSVTVIESYVEALRNARVTLSATYERVQETTVIFLFVVNHSFM